ncbi:MAG: hypothetical protein K2X71_00445 [Methylobacterium sp.]|uniref:hypothetical protein n=1 Tax=Methylobacterium sp. TaxID=409 RepID=UPI00258F723D|nr:hypothetical protein [Methylobacterium sp.]MBY0294505.1 hypothetical protein [Methylobacterium sp.]
MTPAALDPIIESIACLERCRARVQAAISTLDGGKADMSGAKRTLAAIEHSLADLYALRLSVAEGRAT